MTKPLTIRLTILRVLDAARPYALPHETLVQEVNRLVRPALTAEQLQEHLSWLLDQTMVEFLADNLAPDDVTARKWFIKEAGQAALKA